MSRSAGPVGAETDYARLTREVLTDARVWIDQDCCTGAGLCVDHCPELFIVLEDGIGYVHDGAVVLTNADRSSVAVPRRYERAAIDAVERCPGECIYLEPDAPPSVDTDADVIDAEVIEPGSAAVDR